MKFYLPRRGEDRSDARLYVSANHDLSLIAEDIVRDLDLFSGEITDDIEPERVVFIDDNGKEHAYEVWGRVVYNYNSREV